MWEVLVSNHKEIFEQFKDRKDEIEKFMGGTLRWHEANQDAVFGWDLYDADFDESNWSEYFEWYCQCALKLKEVVKKFG